jgi:hypothetical protein
LVVFWSDRLHDFTRCTVPREVDPTIEFLDRNSEIGNLLRQDRKPRPVWDNRPGHDRFIRHVASPVCAENSDSAILVMKTAKDRS